jgi:hypothetical protein
MRINSHQVIQMVGDDRVVFVNDRTMQEVVLNIVDLPALLEKWGQQADRGESFGPDLFPFQPSDYNAVEKTLDYFIECSTVPVEEQMKKITIHEVGSVDDVIALLHGKQHNPEGTS